MMDESLTLQKTARGWSFPLLIMALVIYFGYFAIYGTHGLLHWMTLQAALEGKQAELQRISTERAMLEKRVKLLRDESVDPDMLEEQARAKLGLSEPDEVVILKEQH